MPFVFDGSRLRNVRNHIRRMPTKAQRTDTLRRSRTSVTLLHVHLVFVVKYRRRVMSKRVLATAFAAAYTVCSEHGWLLEEINGEADHLHLMLKYGSSDSISDIVRRLKIATSIAIRAAAFPEVLRKLRGNAFWSPSYFASSCGGAPLDVIKQYIEGQGKHGETPHPAASTRSAWKG